MARGFVATHSDIPGSPGARTIFRWLHGDDMADSTMLSDTQRTNRLVAHLARLVQRGAEIETHDGCRAIVRRRERYSIMPNLIMLISGLVLFALDHGILFLAGAIVAGVGWHRKAQLAAVTKRVLVRVDELGRISECDLDGSTASA